MFLIVSMIILLTLNGCSMQAEKPPVQQPKPASVNKAIQADKPGIPAQSGTGTEHKDVTFTYSTQGRRDPFMSLLYNIREKKTAGLTPLQQRSLGELRIIGIVWGIKGNIAMIETPDGKGYVIKEGTPVGTEGGVVKNITEHSVIIEESYTDYYGKKISKKTVLVLHGREESGG